MTDMNTVDQRLPWFVNEMRKKFAMAKNQAKADWREMPVSEIHTKLLEEVGELSIELCGTMDPEAVVKECADVGNFAMELADKIRSLHPEVFP